MAYQPQQPATVQAYQTTTTLGAGATYDSGIIDLRTFTQVDTRITADQDGTIVIRWYSDAAGTDQVRLLTIPYSAANGFQLFSAPAFTPYNRYEYVNGGVAQTDFFFETKLLRVPLSPQILGATAFISEGMVTQLNRSIITGQQPDGDFVNQVSDGTAFTETNLLGAGATFTSPWVDTDGYNGAEIFISSDVASAQGGILIQYTDDVQAPVPVVRASEAFTFSDLDVARGFLELFFQPKLDGFRVLYTNGALNQGSFFLQADVRINRDSARLNSSSVALTSNFEVSTALGEIPNFRNGTKFGIISGIDAADSQPRTVWALADDGRSPLEVERKTFLSASSADVWVASNNAADTNVELTLIINDASNQLITRTVTLDGADARTPVTVGVQALDCNVAFVSGNNQQLVGDVYINSTSLFTAGVPDNAADVFAFVPAADQRTQQATFRVPSNARMVVVNVHSTVTAGTASGAGRVVLRVKPPNGSWFTLRPYAVTSNVALERNEIITLEPDTLVEFLLDDVSGNDVTNLVLFGYDLIFG